MPAKINASDPFKYCNASNIGGYFCPELDIMEGNRYAFRQTGHTCDAPIKDIYYRCDRDGDCSSDVLQSGSKFDYGPGSRYTINTLRPFTVE